MRKYIAIAGAAFLWFGVGLGLFGSMHTASFTLAVQGVGLLTLSVFIGPSFGVMACIILGFLLDASAPTAFGVQSVALLTAYVAFPEALSPLLRSSKVRFITCAIVTPIMFVSVIWFLNSLLGWFDASFLQPIDPRAFLESAISSLWSAALAGIFLLSSKVFITTVGRRFYIRSSV